MLAHATRKGGTRHSINTDFSPAGWNKLLGGHKIFGSDPSMSRAFLDCERAPGLFVHGVDKNGAYTAALGIYLGGGIPIEAPGFMPKENQPGYFLCEITRGNSTFPMTNVAFGNGERGLLTTPPLIAARDLGFDTQIFSSITYPENRRALAPIYNKLRNVHEAASKLPAELGYALGKIAKNVANHGVGNLTNTKNLQKAADGKGYAKFLKPDWRDAVLGSSTGRAYRDIQKWGVNPIAINVDEILFVSKHEDILMAAPGIRLGTGIGEYKITIPARLVSTLPQSLLNNPSPTWADWKAIKP
jgi:hypothetical protein